MKKHFKIFTLFLAMCLLLNVTVFADGYRPEEDMEPIAVEAEEHLTGDRDVMPLVNYLNFTYDGWKSTNGWFTADIVLLYNEAYDRFERLVSFSNFDSEYYRNIIINSKTCTFSSSNQKATIVVNYTAQDKKTNVVEKGNATFVVTIWD